MPKDDYYIFFMDTEGLDSIDRDTTADSKLFALSVLLSSFFIFNSLGCIDESSISQLSIITHLIQNVTVHDGQKLQYTSLWQYYLDYILYIRAQVKLIEFSILEIGCWNMCGCLCLGFCM